jgi:hypothetical protein
MRRPLREVNAQLKRLRGALLEHPQFLEAHDELNGLSAEGLIETAIAVLRRMKDKFEERK